MTRFVIADTHFGHKNIIQYCNRPFFHITEMNEELIIRWNAVVKPEDTVYHLGDVGFCSTKELEKILSKLNGKKILILGNHDRGRSIKRWKELGFNEVHKGPLDMGEYVLSHEPLWDCSKINVCGHVHDLVHYLDFNNVCVSVELINYTPIDIKEVLHGSKA